MDGAVLDGLFRREQEAGLDFILCGMGFGYAGGDVFS
jgi:hypothetical protein